MEPAQTIRAAVARVTELRQLRAVQPALRQAVAQIKRFQSQRFARSYADLLAAEPFCHPAQFFLDELYGERDFAQRDQQFARIASGLQRVFPQEVVATAVALAELHALSEALDHAMGQAWLDAAPAAAVNDTQRYVRAWRQVGQAAQRQTQLRTVLTLGQDLSRLTRTPGLRLMLRMMRGPAAAAGLADLQRFLESGFDHFAAMARQPGQTQTFLDLIQAREAALMQALFADPADAGVTFLQTLLGQAR